jgi:hypothetical protein
MLHLDNVDLIIIDCLNVSQAIDTIKICTDEIKFGNVILFTHENVDAQNDFKVIQIENIDTIEKYSDFCLRLSDYLDNDFVLLVQNDGFIINPNLWQDGFLNYDYIGAPWNMTFVPGQRVGNGGFSLRSKKFLNFSSKFDTTNGIPEDNFLCLHNYDSAIEFGLKFAPTSLASNFAHEYHNPYKWYFEPKNHFGFHGKENVEEAKKFILKRKSLALEV